MQRHGQERCKRRAGVGGGGGHLLRAERGMGGALLKQPIQGGTVAAGSTATATIPLARPRSPPLCFQTEQLRLQYNSKRGGPPTIRHVKDLLPALACLQQLLCHL